jgi:hypothetical protein
MATLTKAQFASVMEAIQPGASQYPQGMSDEYAQYQKNPENYINTLPGAGPASDITQRFRSYSALVQGQGGETAAPAAPVQTQGIQGAVSNASAANADTSYLQPGEQPEQAALRQLAQIDPTSEALRNQLGMSYLTNLNQTQTPAFTPGQAPSAADVQGYLDLYKQIDPQGYAQRAAMTQQVSDYVTKATGQAPTSAADALSKYSQLDPQGFAQYGQLSGAMGSYLSEAQQQAALGSQLDPQTIRELEQSTRAGQSARGNVYGTPRLVAEAMTRGQAGMAIQQQRQAALGQAGSAMQNYLTSGATTGALGQNLYQQGLANQQNALGVQQGYLSSGQSLGDIANTLYGQGFSRNLSQYQQQLAALNMAQQGSLGYLGSGQTPYGAGSSYLNMAQQNAANAAQGGSQYNPSSLSPGMTGTSQQAPQYGLDIGAQGQNYYSAMGYQNMMQPQGGSNTASYIGAAANVAGSLAKSFAK